MSLKKVDPTIFPLIGGLFGQVVWVRVNPNEDSSKTVDFSLRIFSKEGDREVDFVKVNRLCLLKGVDDQTGEPVVNVGSMFGFDSDGRTKVFSNTFFPSGKDTLDNAQRKLYRRFTEAATSAVKAFIEADVETQEKLKKMREVARSSPNPQLQMIAQLGQKSKRDQHQATG